MRWIARRSARSVVVSVAVLTALGVSPFLASAGEDGPVPSAPAPKPAPSGAVPEKVEDVSDLAKVIHNYVRLSEHLSRGAQPEGDAAFAALAKAGVKTLLSVDGSRPDVETAKKYGLRYVHIPFGYDGIPEGTELELAKAFLVLAPAGPIFVHCHHGKHRGPAGCAIGRIVLDGLSPEEAVKDLAVAGTDPKYKGLYASVAAFVRPTPDALAKVSADLPEVAPTPALTEAMVQIDHTWDRMKAVRMAKWASPPDHPDVDPSHEAVILAEHFRELARRPDVASKPEAFRRHLKESEDLAWALSKALEKSRLDPAAASTAFDASQASCAACHKDYRDNAPRGK